ncbi:MAG: hypothetical protein HY748_01710 [Elusimicrobia bacterium]|nr:hypothetical protein [Elusimicrobiota bacterium]
MEAAAPPQGMRGRPLNLPDISIIGVVDGHLTDDRSDAYRDRLEFREVELALQGFIYPQMRADVFLALHKHEDEYDAEICEAKAGFLRLAEGLSAEVGKIHVNFGKLNKMHTHHRPMIDQPQALTGFFGDHGLIGQGGTASYLFPLPFYLQAEGGVWRAPAHHHHAEGAAEVADLSGNTVNAAVYEESEEFSMSGELFTGRLKASFAPTAKSELEIGTSLAAGHGSHYTHHKDKAMVSAVDLTFRVWPSSYAKWTLQNEWLHLSRKVPPGNLERDGFYSYLSYRFDKHLDLGGRFDYAEGAWPVRSFERSFSAIAGYHLTETSAVRLQYKVRGMDDKTVHEGWLQLAFGLGPHSHELE